MSTFDVITYFYQLSILCMFAVPFVDLLPDCALDYIVNFRSVAVFFVPLPRQVGHAHWHYTPSAIVAPLSTPASTFAFSRSTIILHHRVSLTLRIRPINASSDSLHTFQPWITNVPSSNLHAYAANMLGHLAGIVALAVLDLICVLIREWKMVRRTGADAVCKRIEGFPVCLLIGGAPTRLLIKGSLTRLLVEGPPTHLSIKGPLTRLLIKGSPPRKLITGLSTRLLIKGPPIRKLLSAPPVRLLVERPPAWLLTLAPTRRLIEGPPTRKFLEASPHQHLIEGLPTLWHTRQPFNRRLVDGPLLPSPVTAPLPLLAIHGSPARRLVTALPYRLIEAPLTCAPITIPPAPLDTSQDPTSPQGKVAVLEAEVGAEVPVCGTAELSEQLVGHQFPERLSVIYSKKANWVAEDTILAEPFADAEDWELIVIRKFNEAVILFDLPQRQESSLGSDSSSDYSAPPSSTSSPVPSTDSYSSSEATAPEVSTTSGPFRDGVRPCGNSTDQDENPCEELQVGHHIPDDDELVDPLSDFNRAGHFLRDLTIPDFEPVAHGGFGVVWKGINHQGNPYAVKLVARIPENEEMLRHEIKAMKRARGSQWTVELYHEEASAGDFLLVMEWCAGGDLFDLWKNSGGYVLAEEAIHYTAQLLLGIHDLHTRGIVHRDIKFENVMLHHGRIKIIDLGLAITFDHDSVSRRFEIFHLLKSIKGDNFPLLHADDHNPHIVEGKCGTPGYFPPEVGEVERYSFGVDYYAMGIMFHAMLTSDHPYYYCSRTKRYDFTELVLDPLDILNTVEMDFLMRVLAPNPRDRLSVRRMKAHPIFSDIDWTELERGTFRHPTLR